MNYERVPRRSTTDMQPASKQARYQDRMRAAGLCFLCGSPLILLAWRCDEGFRLLWLSPPSRGSLAG